MTAADHYRDSRSFHTRHKLRDSKSGFHISAHGIEDYQQTFDSLVLLDCNESGNDMLIFRGLVLRREDIVTLDLADNGKAMYEMIGVPRGYNSSVRFFCLLRFADGVHGIGILFFLCIHSVSLRI